MKRYRIDDEMHAKPCDLRRVLFTLLCAILILISLPYVDDARDRLNKHEWQSEISPDGRYNAQYTYIARETALVQIRDMRSGNLLAERTFSYGVPVSFIWNDNWVMYTTNDGSYFGLYDGFIQLPPSFFDRVVAHIP